MSQLQQSAKLLAFLVFNVGTSSMYIFILVDNERNDMRQSVHKKSTSEKCSQSSSGLA